MKKIIGMLVVMLGIGVAVMAQDTQVKVKKTSTPRQKVHNTFSKKKRYSGVKAKAKTGDKKVVTEVKTNGDAEIKHD